MDPIECNLNVFPITDIQSYSIQKCLIPREGFPQKLFPSSLVKCFDSFNQQSICRLYPMDHQYTRNFCYLDNTVSILSPKNSNGNYRNNSIVRIEPFHLENDEIDCISLIVVVNENIFKLTPNLNIDHFIEITNQLLQLYTLANNCIVRLDEFGISLGIDEIIVKANTSKAFNINSVTKITIENVKISRKDSIEFSDLGGLDKEFSELNDFVNNLHQHKTNNSKTKFSSNALIVGQTGSGKTSICNNFLIQHNCNLFLIRSSEIIRQYPGETEEALREIFQNSKNFVEIFKPNEYTVILIENLELICPVVQNNNNLIQNTISSQLIALLDDFYSKSLEIFVLATTSKVDMINVALRRPGRFEKEIYLPALNEQNRISVLSTILKKAPFNQIEINLSDLINHVAKTTPGYVGADLQLLLQNVIQSILRKKCGFNITCEELKTHFDESLKMIKPASIRGTDISVYKSDMKFENIGGMMSLKKKLETSILAGLKHTEAYKRFGLELPKGILLYGPPGCAKTTIAKCLANEANMTFISTSGAEVYSPYVGCAEKFIAKIFDTARKNAPCIIFLDEIDTLVGKRNSSSKSDVQTRILSTLLTEMDGIGVKLDSGTMKPNQNNILVIGATNRPDMIDSALMRPGRFDKLIHVPAPDYQSRLAIFQIYKKQMPFSNNVELEKLAELTEKYSGVDICNLCNEAAMDAFTNDFNTKEISRNNFEYVLSKIKPSLLDKQIKWYYDFEKKYIH